MLCDEPKFSQFSLLGDFLPPPPPPVDDLGNITSQGAFPPPPPLDDVAFNVQVRRQEFCWEHRNDSKV